MQKCKQYVNKTKRHAKRGVCKRKQGEHAKRCKNANDMQIKQSSTQNEANAKENKAGTRNDAMQKKTEVGTQNGAKMQAIKQKQMRQSLFYMHGETECENNACNANDKAMNTM